MRLEQQIEAYSRLSKAPLADARHNVHASFPAEPTLALLVDLEDLFDRVKLLEAQRLFDRVQLLEAHFRRWEERLQFLHHVSRMLGHEDWNDFDLDDRTPRERGELAPSSSTSSSIDASSISPEPGSLVTAAQAGVPAPAVPASSSSPDELAGVRHTRQ